jgi:hypothetical protein
LAKSLKHSHLCRFFCKGRTVLSCEQQRCLWDPWFTFLTIFSNKYIYPKSFLTYSSVLKNVKFFINPWHLFLFSLSQVLMHFHALMSLDNCCYKILMAYFQNNWMLPIYFGTLEHSLVNATKEGIQFECQWVWCLCNWPNYKGKDL